MYLSFLFYCQFNKSFSDLDMAIAYWNIVLSGRFKFLHLWSQFLQVSIHNTGSVIVIFFKSGF